MLSEVLRIVAQDRSTAMTEIAHKLGWTLQRVENSIAQLELMGFIRKQEIISSTCGAGGCSGCSGCSADKSDDSQRCPNSADKLYTWIITDRGKSALH